jgi:aminoglycoside phosphotransferase (APT) family kinase protein
MPQAPDLAALAAALKRLTGFDDVDAGSLEPLRFKGLAHDHLAIGGRDLLLRVPKQSQFALSAADNLAYQAACFERVAESGHGPRLCGLIAPSAEIPMGALVVQRIFGRPPALPADLPACAEAMARVHALPLPPAAERPPLADHQDPVADALSEIEGQAAFLEETGLAAGSQAEIEDELAWARDFARAVRHGSAQQPVALVLSDTHPGNFLIDGAGRAVIVDLEKALYGSPGTDLAHATVYSSTTWDPDTWADLGVEEVAAFYRHYLAALTTAAGPGLAAQLTPWLVPMRRLLFLRAITWCVKWSVLHRRGGLPAKHAAPSTEDWSADNSDPQLIAHVAGRVADYLSPATLARMRGEWLGPAPLAGLIGAEADALSGYTNGLRY